MESAIPPANKKEEKKNNNPPEKYKINIKIDSVFISIAATILIVLICAIIFFTNKETFTTKSVQKASSSAAVQPTQNAATQDPTELFKIDYRFYYDVAKYDRQKNPRVAGVITNIGTTDINYAVFRVYVANNGKDIWYQDFPIQFQTSDWQNSAKNQPPLKPGFQRDFTFYLTNIPSTWESWPRPNVKYDYSRPYNSDDKERLNTNVEDLSVTKLHIEVAQIK